ncbi:SCP2 sterol-binding domain-containing protein [Actinocorallia sp. API 0066]|uniref:SCP2 sterol-binding domain-containing protein n=1 Tax=Actinocorallia sp. API 0066 TaxID=2896846 RepID=UPI001E44861F|nr:SCP2 sterol-binding domain-containing protein [Actinocorallia sp. API 0066]MCD0451436.1 SCP2 sterol-binding domain-containing protein [Actinocorallia sp. API 0066]
MARKAKHVFLSNAWLDAVEALRPAWPAPPAELDGLLINLVVKGGPDGDVQVHTNSGVVARGLDDSATTTVTVPYEVAQRLYVENDPSLVITSIMSGELTIEGDSAQVMALVSVQGEPTPEQLAFQRTIQDLTA